MPENAVRAVLEAYTVTGELGLARREGNRRYYDLLERLLPAELLAQEVPEQEKLRHKLRPGTAPTACSAPGVPAEPSPASHNPPRPRSVGGAKSFTRNWSSAARSCPSTSRACAASASWSSRSSHCCRRHRSRQPSVAFIAPFDSLLWDTTLLASLFDFDYVWEGFFPAAKRRWGYYVLPISFGERLVGRIEPRIDRQRAVWRRSTSGGGRLRA